MLLFRVPTSLVLVGASNVPSVVRANEDVVALCRIVSVFGETTAQLAAPRRVRAATRLDCWLIMMARAACSSPTYVAVPETALWSNVVGAGPARTRRLFSIS